MNISNRKENVKVNIKRNLKAISKDNSAQGAAEYILLFGGVIVIALAGLLIYRSYFSNNASGLNATEDISSIRNNVTSIY
ncbi:class III signal peptide-containing protein [Methanobrevibacter sp.]|uniref:class III signal peptide-containing protein n=1 Tax=Methanobrevibacter sp. TaxID=66852 RepID=UPI00388EBB4D